MELLVFIWFAKDTLLATPCNGLDWVVVSTIPEVLLGTYRVLDTNDVCVCLLGTCML